MRWQSTTGEQQEYVNTKTENSPVAASLRMPKSVEVEIFVSFARSCTMPL